MSYQNFEVYKALGDTSELQNHTLNSKNQTSLFLLLLKRILLLANKLLHIIKKITLRSEVPRSKDN